MSRHFPTNDIMLQYRIVKSNFFSDTMFTNPKTKYNRGNTWYQLFVSGKVFFSTYPIRSVEEFKISLHWFCKEIGAPVNLIVKPTKDRTYLTWSSNTGDQIWINSVVNYNFTYYHQQTTNASYAYIRVYSAMLKQHVFFMVFPQLPYLVFFIFYLNAFLR